MDLTLAVVCNRVRQMFLTRNQYIAVKNAVGRSAVMSSEGQVFVFCENFL